MTEADSSQVQIGTDAPLADPKDDEFGYAPFATRLADALIRMASPHGQVMAIHGPWGSGKSTLLNFVKHGVSIAQAADRPVIIDFNPWWFDGRDQLASQFLSQFRAKLPHESEALRKIGDTLADYSGALGKVVSVGFGTPLLDIPISFLLKLFKRKPKDIPSLKKEVAAALAKAGKRFVIVIDDIDRLSPDEILELFKVVKALADFPNVIYLLSFDRQVVAEALRVALKVDGEAYLEKIIQAPFSLPAVDHLKIQQKFLKNLDRILEENKVFVFDSSYWANIYHAGIDQFIRKPRDVVRVANALSITFSATCGEVNPVDFIALEVLRLFQPDVYSVIRNNVSQFTGHISATSQLDKTRQQTFHNSWLETVPDIYRIGIKSLVMRMFPRLDGVWGNTFYDASSEKEWRRNLRACSPGIFPFYFQLGVPDDSLSRQELNTLISFGSNFELICSELMSASAVRRPDGSSKSKEYLTKLLDLGRNELPLEFNKAMLKAIFEIGDQLIIQEGESIGMFAIDSIYPILWLVSHLVGMLPDEEVDAVVINTIEGAHALVVSTNIVSQIVRHVSNAEDAQGQDSSYSKLTKETCSQLKTIALNQLRNAAKTDQLLNSTNLQFLLNLWGAWGSNDDVTEWMNQIIVSPEMLPKLLSHFLRYGTRQNIGDTAVQRIPFLNPKDFEPYVPLDKLEQHVQALIHQSNLSASQTEAVKQFLKGMALIKQGKDLSNPFSQLDD